MGQATSLEHKGKNAKKIALILDESHFKRKKEKKKERFQWEVCPCNSLWRKIKRGCPSLIQQAEKLVKSLFFTIFIVRMAPKDT